MPDLINRPAHEKELAESVLRSWADVRARFANTLGDPPDLSNVPDAVWHDLKEACEDRTRQALAILFLLGSSSLGDAFGDSERAEQFTERLSLRADTFAEKRAAKVAGSMVDTLQNRLAGSIADARARIELGTRPVADIMRDLMKDADETILTQAETIGTTETTLANSAGEMKGRDEIDKHLPEGELLTAHWVTERDGRACPICEALDGKSEWEWMDEYPLGPPAHPNCRCYLIWTIDEDPAAQIEKSLAHMEVR